MKQHTWSSRAEMSSGTRIFIFKISNIISSAIISLNTVFVASHTPDNSSPIPVGYDVNPPLLLVAQNT